MLSYSCLGVAAILLLPSTASISLSDNLKNAIFMHGGDGKDMVRASDKYEYLSMNVSYNEPDNVTCAHCQWSVGNPHWQYLWQVDPTATDNPEKVKAPPMGIRSSPALGGVSCGSVELRSDGSFRDWTIFNQGPAGSGKYGLVDDVWMAAKLGSGQAKMIRTHPPHGYGTGVDALDFSGTYPLTRLRVSDVALPGVDIFGYSTLKPTSLKESAYPAVVLTMQVTNPTSTAQNASFMLNLPFGAWTDCGRSSSNGTIHTPSKDHPSCMAACAASTSCHSWQFDNLGQCKLNPDVPLTYHWAGSYCGVKSAAGWTATPMGGAVPTRNPRHPFPKPTA